MKRRYGDRWQRVFYATANKTELKPGTVENRRAALHALQDDRRKKRK